ncbi:MAG TPA: hypothetical protein VMT22_04580 [Terriglobales bacterium]|nr:hypothetical protein [Terriglobales bacterium]
MPRKLPRLSLPFRQTLDLYEVIYSVVYGAIFSALFPDYLKAADAFGVSEVWAVVLIAPALVVTLGGLSYNARLRTGAFEFKREAFTVIGPILAAAMLSCTLYAIDERKLLTLLGLWTAPYLAVIAFGPALRRGGWFVRAATKGSRN